MGTDLGTSIRIAVTTSEGDVIEIIECTLGDLRRDIQRNPSGLLADVGLARLSTFEKRD